MADEIVADQNDVQSKPTPVEGRYHIVDDEVDMRDVGVVVQVRELALMADGRKRAKL